MHRQCNVQSKYSDFLMVVFKTKDQNVKEGDPYFPDYCLGGFKTLINSRLTKVVVVMMMMMMMMMMIMMMMIMIMMMMMMIMIILYFL